jgi:hypothetical protein
MWVKIIVPRNNRDRVMSLDKVTADGRRQHKAQAIVYYIISILDSSLYTFDDYNITLCTRFHNAKVSFCSSSSRMSGFSRKSLAMRTTVTLIVVVVVVVVASLLSSGTMPLDSVDNGHIERKVETAAAVSTSTSTSTTPPPPGARSRFDQHGSWMGNTWIPPKGWSTFSALDMLELYKDKHLLWLGDSTAR